MHGFMSSISLTLIPLTVRRELFEHVNDSEDEADCDHDREGTVDPGKNLDTPSTPPLLFAPMPSDTAGAPAASSKLKIFLKRLFSTVVLWAIVLGALFSGNRTAADLAMLIVLNVICFFALLEFGGLVVARGGKFFRTYALTGGFCYLVISWWAQSGRPPFDGNVLYGLALDGPLAGAIVFGLLVRRLFWTDMTGGTAAIGATLLGLVYVPWLLNYLQRCYFLPRADGSWWLLYFILVTKASDMGAYAVGSLIGRHKMIPRVSPGKTWEGFGGAILVSTAVSLVFAHFAQNYLTGMTVVHAAILGVLLGVGAVAGDLVESLFKREAGVKDSGRYFPGIGGVLDLVDSLLFNAPIMYAYLVWLMMTK